MDTQGVIFTIYVDCEDDGNEIISEVDNCDFNDEDVCCCYASWSDDDAIEVSAQIPYRWNENRAIKAMEDVLGNLELAYEDVEACLE